MRGTQRTTTTQSQVAEANSVVELVIGGMTCAS